MAQDPTFASRLRALALALLNATLLLAIILVIVALLLVSRVQKLADTAAGALGSVTEEARATVAVNLPKVGEALERLKGLEARLEVALAGENLADTATVAELAALRAEVQALSGQVAELSDGLQAMGRDGYQALVAAMRTALSETAARLEGHLPENRGTE